jgi:capsular polysaccharide biosynthesis protein
MEELLINDVIKTVKKYFWVILLFAILGGVIGRMMTADAPAPTYEASSLFFIEPKVEEINGVFRQTEDSGRFFNTAQTIINTPIMLDPVIKELKLDMSIKELSEKVRVSNENNSNLMRVTVSNANEKQATVIANTIVQVYNQEIHNYLDVEKMKIVEEAQNGSEIQILYARPKANMIMGVLIGLVLGTFASFILSRRVKAAR